MSVDYTLEIFSNKTNALQINFAGFKDGVAIEADFKMTVYAFNKNTGSAIFSQALDLQQARELYSHLSSVSIIRDGTESATGKFIETTADVAELVENIKGMGIEATSALIKKLKDDERIPAVLEALNELELENLSAAYKQQHYASEINKLEKMLELEKSGDIVTLIKSHEDLSEYVAGQPEKIFQKWIEANMWVFGVEYIDKHDGRKIALFSEADILVESLDGYLDLIELKRPKPSHDIFTYDTSHKCYYPSSSLSQVIGQSLFYLQKMDDYKLILEKEYKVKILRPRIKIIVGRTDNFNQEQMHALRMLNSNLDNIQVYSYDYLVSSGKKLISHYE